jgi:hypothetical protein
MINFGSIFGAGVRGSGHEGGAEMIYGGACQGGKSEFLKAQQRVLEQKSENLCNTIGDCGTMAAQNYIPGVDIKG